MTNKIVMEAESLVQNSGHNPSRVRILYFYVRYSNRNILSFSYQNQVNQKSKFMYASRTTTLMKDSKWEKIILKNRIWQQSGWLKRVSWSNLETNNAEHPDMTESVT
jgi:hypothetical protein